MSHRDILIGTLAATFAGAIGMLASMARWGAIFGGGRDDNGGGILGVFLVSIGAGMAAVIVQMAISRQREFEADAGAARLLGDPSPLVNALRKLEIAADRVPVVANQATAHSGEPESGVIHACVDSHGNLVIVDPQADSGG